MHTKCGASRPARATGKCGLGPGERALRMASRREKGLYDPRNEHDACGVGFVANIKGRKSHDIIRRGLQILVNLDHRGAVGADPLIGDGAGCMIQMPDALLRHWAGERGLELPPPGRYAVAMCFLPMDAEGARRRGRACRAFRPRRGADAARLARGRRRYDRARQDRHRDDAVYRPGDRRGRARNPRPGPVRAQDPDDPQAGAEQRRPRWPRSAACRRCANFYMPSFSTRTRRLQGPAAGAAGRELLRRSAQPADRVGAGAGASALLDQHVPVVASGAPVPLHLPQRRDQHGARQHQLDGGAPPGDVVRPARAPISPRWCR